MKICKRDQSLQDWDWDKVIVAVGKAVTEVGCPLIRPDVLCCEVERKLGLAAIGDSIVGIEQVQDAVEQALMSLDRPKAAKAYILYRDRQAKDRDLKPDPDALANYIHPAKYGRYRLDLERRETFEETVTRVMDMHAERFPAYLAELADVKEAILQKRILPSMRSMQFGGSALLQHNARMYNCSGTLIDRLRAFQEIFYLLLCGCGVGYNVHPNHVAKLPPLARVNKHLVHHFAVPDTIEGWADCIGELILSYVDGYCVEFNYSLIRPEGSPLKASGGKAPGHLPLRRCVEQIRVLLDKAVGRKLMPIECHDMICYIAEAVLAGGIRRSSLIALFAATDQEMLSCKAPENFQHGGLNAHRAMANNSVIFVDEDYATFKQLFAQARVGHGEPGIYFTDSIEYVCNPCGEIGMWPVIPQGTGFSFCNLVEINGAKCKNQADLENAAELATILATMQATYTSFPYLGETTEFIAQRDALLGVSITGIMDSPEVCLDRAILRDAAGVVVYTNERWAARLGINPGARLTAIKPSGTASLELGGVASGIRPHHAKRYFRRVTANPLEPVAQYFRSVNPHMVETMPNGDWSITFPVVAPAGAVTIQDLAAVDHLEYIFTVYDAWVKTGVAQLQGPSHNISATVTVREEEWDRAADVLYKNQYRSGGITFFPLLSDKAIPFMPMESVVTEIDRARWHILLENYEPVDYTKMVEFEDTTALIAEPACSGGLCDRMLSTGPPTQALGRAVTTVKPDGYSGPSWLGSTGRTYYLV